MDTAQPGWYPDPWVRGQHRYWDGAAWTAHAFPDSTGPTSGAAPASWAPPSEAPPPPTWVPPATWAPPPPPPPFEPPPATGWRMPTGLAFAALLCAVGLIVGFIAAITTYYALGGHSKQVVNAAAPTAPTIILPPTPTTIAPSSPFVPGNPATPSACAPVQGGAAVPGESSLAGLNVSQADVPADVVVQPIPCGDQVAGQTTLDLCNGTFPSESQRVARRQVAAVNALGNVALSTEAVLYSGSAGSTQAFSELKSVAAKCPSTPVVSPVGEATVTTKFNAPPDSAWPQVATVERLAYDFVSTDDTGQTQHSIAVYLRRGRVLEGVYLSFPDASQLSVQGQRTTAGIVNVFANRIAALPASVVGG